MFRVSGNGLIVKIHPLAHGRNSVAGEDFRNSCSKHMHASLLLLMGLPLIPVLHLYAVLALCLLFSFLPQLLLLLGLRTDPKKLRRCGPS